MTGDLTQLFELSPLVLERHAQPDALPTIVVASSKEAEAKPEEPYQVILHNDDLNGFDYVVEVLCKVLGCNKMRAA